METDPISREVYSALQHYSDLDKQIKWRREFFHEASSFFLKNIPPIAMEELYKEEERVVLGIDEVVKRYNPIWRTRTLNFGTKPNQYRLEMMGIAHGTKINVPQEIKINLKAQYDRTLQLYKITKECALSWNEQPMTPQQQTAANEILAIFKNSYSNP